MSDVTRILSQAELGDPTAAGKLLPLVYDELRHLAAAKLAVEKPGQTLQATALVHEAYLRLVGPTGQTGPDAATQGESSPRLAVGTYNSRGHFFAAAAEAMRRILVDHARRKQSLKEGGQFERLNVELDELCKAETPEEILAINEALHMLAQENPTVARLVELKYFVGLTLDEAANVLGVSVRTAHRYWVYAKAWLFHKVADQIRAEVQK